ncbi:isochorismatase family protein [Lentimicrobium sp. L6]|uniref:isochorismatase family protein n=1 Tax=Lentimicrobium sp. L6 TaxID=2735916 RepID=UPI001C1325BA
MDKFLIVMGFQEYNTNGKLSESASQNTMDAANRIIEILDPDHVVYIKRIHKILNLSFSFPLVYTSHDTIAMQFDKRLVLVNENIISREKSNAFSSEELLNFLVQNNAKEIMVIGLLAEEFISQSILEGQEIGFDMYMIPEAIQGQTPKKKDKAIKKLTKLGIKTFAFHSLNDK